MIPVAMYVHFGYYVNVTYEFAGHICSSFV